MSLVPVTEEEKKLSYYKYFERPMAKVDPERIKIVDEGPMDSSKFLTIFEINELLKPGRLACEFGYAVFEDGTGTLANNIKMPGVTPQMFDWWFAWHGLEPLRYKIWDPEDHYASISQNPEKNKEASLSMKERYWNTTHYTEENVGALPPGFVATKEVLVPKVPIRFIPPVDFGFDPELLKDFDGTIVCGGGINDGIVMCHMLRRGEDGDYELRTRFWFGWNIVDKKPVLNLPVPTEGASKEAKGFPLPLIKMLLKHNLKEFSNLAKLLPDIYPEEKDNF